MTDTLNTISCSGIRVTQRPQYITSRQIQQKACPSPRGDMNAIPLTTDINLKTKLTFQKLHGAHNTSYVYGYIKDGIHSNISKPISFEKDDVTIVTENHDVVMLLGPSAVLLISFQGKCLSLY